MGAGSETDAALTDSEFIALADDKHYFPPYECAIVIRDETLTRFPQLKPALEELSGKISAPAMRQLNADVDRRHQPISGVAREFLSRISK